MCIQESGPFRPRFPFTLASRTIAVADLPLLDRSFQFPWWVNPQRPVDPSNYVSGSLTGTNPFPDVRQILLRSAPRAWAHRQNRSLPTKPAFLDKHFAAPPLLLRRTHFPRRRNYLRERLCFLSSVCRAINCILGSHWASTARLLPLLHPPLMFTIVALRDIVLL